MSLNHIQLTDFIVAEWYKKDALLPLSTGPLAQNPAPASAAPGTPPTPQATPTAPPPPTANVTPLPSTPIPLASKTATPEASPAPPAAQPALKVDPPTPEIGQTYKMLGNNRRHIAVLVQSPGTPFLPDNQLAFLTKILEACRMTLADVAIVNNATTPVLITALRQQLQPKVVLLFGVDPTTIRLPINFPHFKQLNYDDCMYLSSPALDHLVPNTEDSKLLKSKLWVSLKTLFNV
jgi:hypothetical protein